MRLAIVDLVVASPLKNCQDQATGQLASILKRQIGNGDDRATSVVYERCGIGVAIVCWRVLVMVVVFELTSAHRLCYTGQHIRKQWSLEYS